MIIALHGIVWTAAKRRQSTPSRSAVLWTVPASLHEAWGSPLCRFHGGLRPAPVALGSSLMRLDVVLGMPVV